MGYGGCPSLFLWFFPLLDRHILELARFEHLAAFLALNVFRIFIAGNNLYLRMLAEFTSDFLFSGLRGLDRRHMHSESSFGLEKAAGRQFREIGGILGRGGPDVKSPKEAGRVGGRPAGEVGPKGARRILFSTGCKPFIPFNLPLSHDFYPLAAQACARAADAVRIKGDRKSRISIRLYWSPFEAAG